jgi:hypothetical protein
VLSMALDKNTVSFSKLVTKQKPQNYKEILWIFYPIMFVWSGRHIGRLHRLCWMKILLKMFRAH